MRAVLSQRDISHTTGEFHKLRFLVTAGPLMTVSGYELHEFGINEATKRQHERRAWESQVANGKPLRQQCSGILHRRRCG